MNSFARQANSQCGYSLMEVLVAFAILSLAVGAILSLFATGLRNTAVASDYARALTLAESQLAYYQGIDARRLDVGSNEGVEEGFTWLNRISLYREDAMAGGARLYRIDVDVRWGEGAKPRAVQLSTLRIGKAP